MNRTRAVFLLLLLLGLALGGCGRKTALTLPPTHSVTPAAPTAPVHSPAAR
ncbi:LPS translocon maturation chaperone LptM [Acidithiobacillus ferriphilus]|uniref:LPS translocon maturation chaperone LptM n=1 Tax=Acidithiobacillus ferriphilus TaxID=1689834 RepID=UPI00232B30B8|nr:lipoprotein [Acidithiobacillus ferriphilus]WCE94198.1 lipoprotein [Acidithiobacillus ferriphilus]